MPALPISNVRQDLFGLVKRVNDDHDPVTVVTRSGENAVLVAESDWNSIVETMYVLRTHGGAGLLASAEDARAGRTEAHALLDPEEPAGPDDGDPGFADRAPNSLRAYRDRLVAALRELIDHTRHVADCECDLRVESPEREPNRRHYSVYAADTPGREGFVGDFYLVATGSADTRCELDPPPSETGAKG